jgi:tRNA-uridine 2-sulfurtransferase
MKNNEKKNKRVIVAMSGGVDSSVAAAMLKKQGYDVIGIFMKLWSDKSDKTDLVRENICCSLEAATAARAVANQLHIPFYVVNFADVFKKTVVDYYIKEYSAGRTPNPCVICNRDIKGEILMNKVMELGGDYLATGHYARIEDSGNPKFEIRNLSADRQDPKPCLPAGRQNQNLAYRQAGDKSRIKNENTKYQLMRSKDKNKDQTYFLWTLSQEKLAKLMFPIGHLTKPEVRRMASKIKLPTAERRESQGICFIPDRDVCGFLRRRATNLTKSGPIIDTIGKELGIHDGLINYTIGQREHLGLGGPRAYFVVKLNKEENTLIVGENKDLYKTTLVAKSLNWIDGKTNGSISATIRYRHPAEKCHIEHISNNKVKVVFSKPQRAITPGQSIVFYSNDIVLGGGEIDEVLD